MSEEAVKQENNAKTTRYIFYSILSKKEDGSFRRELFREDIEFGQLNDIGERIGRSIYAIFEKHVIEWVVISPTPNLPDVKNLYMQNELFNLNQKVNKLLEPKGDAS